MDKSYSTEIKISVRPEAVYQALTNRIDKWWTESANEARQVGDKLVVRFEKATCWQMIVLEASKNQLLIWQVLEANHDLDKIARKDEWKDTSIQWRIETTEVGSKLILTHQGLVPTLQCFEICQSGWDYFLGSLKSFLETGKGYPFKAAAA